MARAIWTGVLTVGLVNVPVKLHPGVERKDVRFHLLDRSGRFRLRRRLYCEETGEEFETSEATRGYEVAPDQYILISDEEMELLKPQASRAIQITQFVDLDEIDPIYFDRPYILAPAGESATAYRLLLEAMSDTHKVGIARFVMHGREYLAAIRPFNGALCIETMHFNDELADVQSIPGLPVEAHVTPRELEMARNLIGMLTGAFEPENYRKEHRERLLELIDKKAAGEEIAAHTPSQEHEQRDMSLFNALEESLQRAQRPAPASRKKTA